MNAKLWVHFKKEMYLVGHTRAPRKCRCALHLDHGSMETLSCLSYDLFQRSSTPLTNTFR